MGESVFVMGDPVFVHHGWSSVCLVWVIQCLSSIGDPVFVQYRCMWRAGFQISATNWSHTKLQDLEEKSLCISCTMKSINKATLLVSFKNLGKIFRTHFCTSNTPMVQHECRSLHPLWMVRRHHMFSHPPPSVFAVPQELQLLLPATAPLMSPPPPPLPSPTPPPQPSPADRASGRCPGWRNS